MSTTKDLLSQNEIDSLLEIFSSPTEDTNSDILFEVRMAKVLKGIENYFENLGLVFDDVKASKSISEREHDYNYTPEYLYLENVSIDSRLALTLLAARFGSVNRDEPVDRALTSLEEQLLIDVSKEIIYVLEKELDSYFTQGSDTENIVDQSIVVLQDGTEQKISFSFMRESKAESASSNSTVNGTKIEAVLGTISTKVLKKGQIYRVHAFAKERVLLLIDGTLPFMANRLEESDETLLFLLQEAVTDKRVFNGYYLCIAGTVIDDEVLLGLERGTFLELRVYDDVEIHKDGKMVAKAKVLLKSGEIAVKVIEG